VNHTTAATAQFPRAYNNNSEIFGNEPALDQQATAILNIVALVKKTYEGITK
ncbi:17902_t:CDS:1, partial [Racocetra persica]